MTEYRACPPKATRRAPASSRRFLGFALVGAAGTLLHYLVLSALVVSSVSPPGPAAAAGAAAGACLNYWLNRRYTFRSGRRHREALPRYLVLAAVGAAGNGLVVSILSGAGLHFLPAQFIATGLILLLNFSISKKWIFQN